MKKAKAHGIGVHSQEEIVEMGKNDLRVLSDLLADMPFFFGDEPTLLVLVAFSYLAELHFWDKEVRTLSIPMNEMFPILVGLVSQRTKEGTGPAEKQPLPDEPEKGKGDEKEKELEKEPKDKKEKDEK